VRRLRLCTLPRAKLLCCRVLGCALRRIRNFEPAMCKNDFVGCIPKGLVALYRNGFVTQICVNGKIAPKRRRLL
jgi:hypothetical protein